MSLAILTTSTAFLVPHIFPHTNAQHFSHANAQRSFVPVLSVPRAPQPRAFAGGGDEAFVPPSNDMSALDSSLDALSDAQLERLLAAIEPRLKQSERDRIGVFERASPSVAYIKTSVVRNVPAMFGGGGETEYPAGAGSGFVWDDDGHIITNYHVVAGGPVGMKRGGPKPKVTVKLSGLEDEVEATVVGYEADKDLAVLKVDPSKLPGALTPLDIGASANLKVGQSVLAIGNPFGLDFTLTTGIVSALGRDIQGAGGRPIKDCLQTDAAINPGNSGGPLLDSHGRLVGVNTMIYSPGGIGGNVGIGFAIPVDTVRRVVNQIISFGNNARPSIGISVLPDADRERYARSLGRKLEGAIVAEVVPGSPASALKLKPVQSQLNGILLGDMITAVNGTPIKQNEDLLCAIEESEPNEPVRLTVMRSCDPSTVEELDITPVQRKALM